jgi:MarR family transcriptional regulator, lower aerobic nicotinate degradation pathway regulator
MGSHASVAARVDAQRAFEALRRLVRFLRLAARAAEKSGVSAAQLFVLHQLAASPASSLAELAARTLTDASSVSTVVARLVAGKLVTRRASAGDRRRATLALTARGRALVARTPGLAQTRIVEAIVAMPPRDRRALTRALDRLVAAIGADQLPARMLFEDEPGGRRGR